MSITDLLPWKREKKAEIERREKQDPFEVLRRDMNQWFDDVVNRG